MFKKHGALTLLLIISFFISFAQDQATIDSLKNLLPTLKADTTKVQVLNQLSAQMVDVDPDTSIAYAKRALVISRKLKAKKAQAVSLHNIGNGLYNLGDYKSALSHFLEALKLHEEIGNKKGILSECGSIGNIFLELDQPNVALRYFEKALDIATQLNTKVGIASSLIAIGTVHSDNGNLKVALDYDERALKLFKELDYQEAVATCLNNIADIYHKLGDEKKGLQYVEEALRIYQELGNKYGTSLALYNIGDFYYDLGQKEKARVYYINSLNEAKAIGANDRLVDAYEGLYKVEKELGNYKAALEVKDAYDHLKDSIYNLENRKQIEEMKGRYETEKKEKEISILTKDKKIQEEEIRQQRIITLAVAAGGILLLLLAIVAIRGYNQKKSISKMLEIKNEKIERAYNIIEEQHKDIKDSIKYAERIQQAILPSVNFNNGIIDSGFVLFQPKDIVSGDFYWFEKKDNKMYFAAVDCTGHGVPGAFMSIVGHNLLNQSLNEHGKAEPAEILNEVNVNLSAALKQRAEDSTVKDGMDLALCCLIKNGDKYTLKYSGANNPLWYIKRSNPTVLNEIKADKFPIGIFIGETLNQFKQHEIELEKGDAVYIFSDGYADQFGGDKGKKFKYKPLQNLLLSLFDSPMDIQRETLERKFHEWKGDLQQVDDVCIIGVRV